MPASQKFLLLHTYSDNVRAASGSDGAHMELLNSGPVDYWLSREVLQRYTVIRLSGAPENERLLLELFREQLRYGYRLQVASPNLLPKPAGTPLFFRQCLELDVPSSTGGWRDFQAQDAAVFSLLQGVFENTPVPLRAWQRHPAYPALSFIPTLCFPAAASVLQEIVDPRWHIDVMDPDIPTKLYKHFGLVTRPCIAAALNPDAPTDCKDARQLARCRLLLAAWWPGDELAADLRDPANFLLRDVIIDPHPDRVERVLRVSRRFLDFLQGVWLNAYYAPRHYLGDPPRILPGTGYRRELFEAGFFRREDERSAWRRHMLAADLRTEEKAQEYENCVPELGAVN